MVEAVPETDVCDDLLEPAVLGLLPGDREREHDVLPRVQHREQVEELEDEADVLPAELRQVVVAERRDLGPRDLYLPGGRLVEAREDVHQRGLARAGRAHDGRQARLLDVDRDAPECVDGRLALSVPSSDALSDDDRPASVSVHSHRSSPDDAWSGPHDGVFLRPPAAAPGIRNNLTHALAL